MRADRYCIRRLYRSRSAYAHYDDFSFEDDWQLEVYLHALGLLIKNDLKSIIDVGCGSGRKLMTYFKDFDTLGMELPRNVERLRQLYPNNKWGEPRPSGDRPLCADCVICADVIEHVVDPEELVAFLKTIEFRFLVVSTPSRDLLHKKWWRREYWGPPTNETHQREWSFQEFGRYMAGHFAVIDHRVTNLREATQMVICEGKRG